MFEKEYKANMVHEIGIKPNIILFLLILLTNNIQIMNIHSSVNFYGRGVQDHMNDLNVPNFQIYVCLLC